MNNCKNTFISRNSQVFFGKCCCEHFIFLCCKPLRPPIAPFIVKHAIGHKQVCD